MTRMSYLAAAVAVAVVAVAVADPLGPYTIDDSKITVGGLSAGGFMAVQMHVAFSSMYSGAAVFAGGPYYCAQGSLTTATTTCMNPLMGPPSASYLAERTNLAAQYGEIDSTANLGDDRVFLYSGIDDTVVHRPVMVALQQYYGMFINATTGGNVTSEFGIASAHCFPTLDYGETCSQSTGPYIGKCNYDGAGVSLKQIYGGLTKGRGTPNPDNLMTFDQTQFVPSGRVQPLSLEQTGYIYVPTACQTAGTKCGLHVNYHGCEQTLDDIGTDYVNHVGLNEWAESNNIVSDPLLNTATDCVSLTCATYVVCRRSSSTRR